jgi:lipopolysaccharide export system permease protein
MKILDKYVSKNFLTGYGIAFCVLIGMRIITDLFVNLDEFTEHSDLGTLAVIKNIFLFYGFNSTLYFRDFAGMITVVAAAFSFGRMVRSNELVAVMASGVSLKRIIGPILLLSLVFTGVLIIDQELVIPNLADKLVRSHDAIPGQESYSVLFINDAKGSLICSKLFNEKTSKFQDLTILLRKPIRPGIWEVTGRIDADSATDKDKTGEWKLVNGELLDFGSYEGVRPIDSYTSSVTAKNISVRCESDYKTLLSLRQLIALAKQGTEKDLAQLYSQKHFRITDPLINMVMLLISLPILVCRDPKTMKSAVMISFALTGACFVTTFVCKILATEVVFDKVMPELWAWLPVFIFLPVAITELDSMKT